MSALKPKCDFEIICTIIKRNYGFVVDGVKKYDGYDNVNFRITTTLKGNKSNSPEAPQRDYVFKILNKNDIKNTEFVGIFLLLFSVMIHKWRSQKAEKVTHTKGRLLEQAMILFNCVPFQNGNLS